MNAKHVPLNAPNTSFPNPLGQGFSFEGVPPSKWRDKLLEIHVWCAAEMLQPQADLRSVLQRCTAKFFG